MRNISNKKHHKFSPSLNIVVNDGDTVEVPYIYPVNQMKLDMSFECLKTLISERKISCPNGNFHLVFDVATICASLTYNNWKQLIYFAKRNNIFFRINDSYEYDPYEMENYVDSFAKENINFKKGLVASSIKHKTKNNPFINYDNDTELLRDSSKYKPTLISLAKCIVDIMAYDISDKDTITFRLINGEKLDDKTLRSLKRVVDHVKSKNLDKKIDFNFYSSHQYYKKEEFENLLKFEEYVKKNYNPNYELKFHNGNNIINKRQILNANNKISSVVEYLKGSSLSPYEKVMYVHKLLSDKEYYASGQSIDQDVYSCLNSREIVCVTYSTIFNAIFDELNDPCIKTKIQLYDVYNPDNEIMGYHSINNVYIKDSKYSLEGYYEIDITRNNKTDLLNNFMVPINDFTYNSFSNPNKVSLSKNIDVIQKDRILYFDKENEEVEEIKAYENIIENTIDFLNTPLGKKCLNDTEVKNDNNLSVNHVRKAMRECAKRSDIIPVETTKEALKYVASKCFGMNEDESEFYSSNVVMSTIFISLFNCDRYKSKNDFAKTSIRIENENKKLNKENKKFKK